MEFLSDNQLAHYVTMRVGGPAKKIVAVHSEPDVEDAVKYARSQMLPLITIGWGSNIIFSDKGFEGVVLVNKISGINVNRDSGVIAAGGGAITDKVVKEAVAAKLVGLEALSGIPGTIGATPVNNIGAYSQEIKDTLVSIRAFDTKSNQFVEIPKSACGFSYRNSIFKSKEHGRYIITKVIFKLKKYDKQSYKAPGYPSLQAELTKRHITKPSPQDIRQVILDLRSSRLPNSLKLANTGSFYKNPVVHQALVKKLLARYPDMPHYPQSDDTEKLSAAWLIETAGLKGYKRNGFWVYDQHALVLVNESSNSFKDMMAMSDYITAKVKKCFRVTLEIEPEIVDGA